MSTLKHDGPAEVPAFEKETSAANEASGGLKADANRIATVAERWALPCLSLNPRCRWRLCAYRNPIHPIPTPTVECERATPRLQTNGRTNDAAASSAMLHTMYEYYNYK